MNQMKLRALQNEQKELDDHDDVMHDAKVRIKQLLVSIQM